MNAYGMPAPAPAAADPSLALALEEIERLGFTVLRDALPPPVVAALREALDRVLAAQVARVGADALDRLGEAGLARALLEEDDLFLELLRLPALEAIVEALLGPAALVMQQNGIVLPPGGGAHRQQAWHRDLPYQAWVATQPLALGALAVLDAFTEASGATEFLPGSHRHAGFPSEAFATRWAMPVPAPAGSVLVFDAMCLHRGGVNRGSAPRRAVNTLHGVPLLAQQVAFRDRPGLDATLRRRLGLDHQPAPSADAWRARRAARLDPPP